MNRRNTTQQEIAIYQGKKGDIRFRGDVSSDTVLGSLNQIAELFDVQKAAVSRHLKNIYASGELVEKATVSKMETVQTEGKRSIVREITYYNLDAIVSVGYRVNSKQATAFRTWATSVLKRYLVDGYAVNQARLEQAASHFKWLQDTVLFLQSKVGAETLKGKESDLVASLSEYSKTLTVPEQCDKDTLIIEVQPQTKWSPVPNKVLVLG